MIVPHMLQSGTWLCKRFLTIVTFVRTHTSMSTDVTNQGELNCESLAANVTFVRTQTSVDTAVALEIIGLGEGFTTYIALKWTHTSVDKLMPGQGVSVCECLLADVTLECLLLTVCPHVGEKRRLQCKGSSTNLT